MSPRIVFVAPRLPYPLHTGLNQRMFHLLAALADLGPVDLVCYPDPKFPVEERELKPLHDLCNEVHILPYRPSPWEGRCRSRWDVLEQFVLSPRPYLVGEFPGRPLAARVAELAPRADFIWAERIFVSEWLTTGREKTIVDLDDLESVKESRRLALEPLRPWLLALRFDNRKLGWLERRAPLRYARVVVCSERDRRFFPSRHRQRALVVPNGVAARLLSVPPVPRDPATLVMVGTMRYSPNTDAALWFAREIFPLVSAATPGARLDLIGDDPGGALRAVHDGQRIVATGRVEDAAPYVSRATVSLAPLRVGGGTRIKILEALALGTPVVATSVGAEGLDVVPGRHLLIADTPEAFASAVVNLLRDAGARQSLSEAGRRLVAERYTWEAIGERLREDVRAWIEQRHSPAAVRARAG